MEEDNRSYHPSHPFRRYQYHRISEANPVTNNRGTLRYRWESERQHKEFAIPTVSPVMGERIKTPKSLPAAMRNGNSNVHKKRRVLGMTPVDGDVQHCPASLVGNNNPKNPCDISKEVDTSIDERLDEYNQQWKEERSQITAAKQQENTSWPEESQRLFQDYQRRFHRQSLTEQAQGLIDRAMALARTADKEDENACCVTRNNNIDAIALCTRALGLCKAAINDQEEAFNKNEFVGGSYLVTGDIRLRRKGEGLASKIHCLRASLRYQETMYEESLEDCEAAISIWNQKYGSEHVRRLFFRNKELASNTFKSGPAPRMRKASHKHLYLLKARNLAAMGRYKEAVVWLTHPNKLPVQTFQRSSILLETDASMNRFLDNVLHQSRGDDIGSIECKGCIMQEEKGSNLSRSERKNPPAFQTSAAATYPTTQTDMVQISSNKKLWSNLLHSVDKRLNEGMIGTFHATSITRKEGRSKSANAIYQLLRHGPVLFHH